VSDEVLEQMYLFENFSDFGIGREKPVMDGRYVNKDPDTI